MQQDSNQQSFDWGEPNTIQHCQGKTPFQIKIFIFVYQPSSHLDIYLVATKVNILLLIDQLILLFINFKLKYFTKNNNNNYYCIFILGT